MTAVRTRSPARCGRWSLAQRSGSGGPRCSGRGCRRWGADAAVTAFGDADRFGGAAGSRNSRSATSPFSWAAHRRRQAGLAAVRATSLLTQARPLCGATCTATPGKPPGTPKFGWAGAICTMQCRFLTKTPRSSGVPGSRLDCPSELASSVGGGERDPYLDLPSELLATEPNIPGRHRTHARPAGPSLPRHLASDRYCHRRQRPAAARAGRQSAGRPARLDLTLLTPHEPVKQPLLGGTHLSPV